MTFEKIDTGWMLSFDKMEAFLVAGSLNQVRQDYDMDPAKLRKQRRGIYRRLITRNRDDFKEMADEQELLEESEVIWREERVVALDKWLSEYEPGEGWKLEISKDEVEMFLMVLNDRRLHLAARYNFSAEEMDALPEEMPDESIRSVLWEIHFLAIFQEALLRLMSTD